VTDNNDNVVPLTGASIANKHVPPPPKFDPMPEEPWTEYGYARRLIHVYSDRLRYARAWRRWLVGRHPLVPRRHRAGGPVGQDDRAPHHH